MDTKSFNLIQGTFNPADSQEILTTIFSDKISFHQKKNFSSQERFGKNDSVAENRIPVLEENLKQIQDLLSSAKASGKDISISGEITIAYK